MNTSSSVILTTWSVSLRVVDVETGDTPTSAKARMSSVFVSGPISEAKTGKGTTVPAHHRCVSCLVKTSTASALHGTSRQGRNTNVSDGTRPDMSHLGWVHHIAGVIQRCSRDFRKRHRRLRDVWSRACLQTVLEELFAVTVIINRCDITRITARLRMTTWGR